MGYGLSLASSSGIRHSLPHKAISIMGDGGFWHNGLSSGVTSAVFNKHDGILIIIDNGYSAATGGQDIPSFVDPNTIVATTIDADSAERDDKQPIDEACRGAGVKWLRTVSTYSIEQMKNVLREALQSPEPGLKKLLPKANACLIDSVESSRCSSNLLKRANEHCEHVFMWMKILALEIMRVFVIRLSLIND